MDDVFPQFGKTIPNNLKILYINILRRAPVCVVHLLYIQMQQVKCQREHFTLAEQVTHNLYPYHKNLYDIK